jgi:hypothetical protein
MFEVSCSVATPFATSERVCLAQSKGAEVLLQLGWKPPQFFYQGSIPSWTAT